MEEGNRDQSSKGFLTIIEVSEYLSIKTKTLYSLVSSGEMPHYRVGRLIRFKKSDIDSWMDGNKEGKKKDAEIPVRTHKKGGRQRKGPTQDIDRIIKKTIDQVKEEEYTLSYGKSDQIKGLGKEVDHGSL